jgi:hypothetical protein
MLRILLIVAVTSLPFGPNSGRPSLGDRGCDDRGSATLAAGWEAGPPLSCPHDPSAPAFRLFTPSHRAVVRRPGYQLGEARVRWQWIVRYRCTGWWFLPVVVQEVRAYGVVLDVAEHPCADRAGG